MSEFRLPSLGADVDSGTVLEWRVAPGDRVARGDIVVVVDTEKAAIEVEIWEEGTIDRLLVAPGEKVAVGTVLATLRAGAAETPAAPREPIPPSAAPPRDHDVPSAAPPRDHDVPSAAPPRDHDVPSAAPAASPRPALAAPPPAPPAAPAVPSSTAPFAHPPPPPAVGQPGARRIHATPLARRIAADLGVDLARVEGTGIGGAITGDDVRKAAPPPAAAPCAAAAAAAPAPREPLAADRVASIRRRTGEAMERSKREIPHYYLKTRCDVAAALAWLAQQNAARPLDDRLLLAPLLVRAVARGAAAAPELNGHWVGGVFRPGAGIHVGVVISLRGGGVLVPTVRDADRKSVDELMRELREVTARARRGTLRGADVAEATITMTSLGETGVDEVFGVIYPPQVALVGFGRPVEAPVAEAGMVGVRPVVTATLSADHRASDGQRGSRFLAAVARSLRRPEEQ